MSIGLLNGILLATPVLNELTSGFPGTRANLGWGCVRREALRRPEDIPDSAWGDTGVLGSAPEAPTGLRGSLPKTGERLTSGGCASREGSQSNCFLSCTTGSMETGARKTSPPVRCGARDRKGKADN